MKPNDEIVYSINVKDLHTVASDHIERLLTDYEIELVKNRIGDFIDWHQAIMNAIDFALPARRRALRLDN
jgi:hypothetical protein